MEHTDDLWCQYSDLPSVMSYDMPKEKKYPDNVVWNEERGYYAHLLPYATNVGAPVIIPDNISTWKNEKILKTNHYFNKKYDEIKEQYNKLIEEFEWNQMVYSANYNFQPIIGEKYYLYRGNNGETFLSLIKPTEWNREFIGEFELDSDNKWKKIEYGK
jgi:hypothetical protein